MVSTFDQRFRQSGFPMLLAQYGEPVVYYPLAGGSRSIDAIIERSPPAFYDAAGNVVLPEFTISVYNNVTDGILSSELNSGGDQVDLIDEIGDASDSRKTVLKLMSQDSGVTVLALK